MLKGFRFFATVLIILSFQLMHACLKDKHTVPSVNTKEVTDITTISANSGGEITNIGGFNVISKGVCWDTVDYPTICNNSTSEINDLQTFTSNIIDLKPHTKYYVRAYAKNNTGIGYGETILFTTLGEIPSAITSEATNITLTTATLNGIVNPNHLSTSVTFEYGTTSDYGNNIMATQSPISGDSTIYVSINLTGLTAGSGFRKYQYYCKCNHHRPSSRKNV